MADTPDGRSDSLTRWLLRCGLVAGPLFVAAFSVDGAVRPGYRPLRHPVSSLSLGPHGRRQVTNFAITGALYFAGAVGLSRAADSVAADSVAATGAKGGLAGVSAAGLAAVGLIGAAVFPTDPVSGYPPGSPDVPQRPSRAGMAHNLLSAPVFLGIPVAAFAASARAVRKGRPGWGLYCAGSATSMLATMGAAGAGFNQSPRLVNRAGLFQRIAIVAGFGWLTALSGQTLHQVRSPRR